MITLRTLGECLVEVDGVAYGPDGDTVFAALVHLAAERGRHLSRQQLADLFWPRIAPERARHSLRQLLYRLRALRIPVEATRDRIWLPAEEVAETFAAAPSVARLREAQARGTLVVGAYLPGYAPTFSTAFAEWLDGHRSVVEAQVRAALLEAADEHRLRGEWTARAELAREVLRLDPLNQTATNALAECAAMTGAVSEAIALLDRYAAEVGGRHPEMVRPTIALRRQIAEHFPARRYRLPSDRCFVGRSGLVAELAVALLRARNGEGGAILTWGASGIGKTRLATELANLAAMQGLRVVQVQCEESDARQPMAAFVDAVPQLLRLGGALGVAPEAMPFLRRLTEFDPTPREPSPEARDPQYLVGRIRQSIVDLVDAVAGERPLLLVFEDVHWMDAASWTTLRMLVDWSASKPVLILLTSRRPYATGTPPEREVARLEVLEVRALDEAASAELVRAIAEDFGAPLPAGAEAWCGAVGEGNPLFLRELAVHCLAGGEPRAAPPSVQTLLDARIARLGPTARRTLQAMAVLGEHSTVARLDRVLEMPAHELLGALDELTEAALIASTGAAVRPRHELVAARVAAATSPAARRLLHRRAATVLEGEVERGAATDAMWACAAHWQAAGDSSRALELALSAANQLIEIGLPGDALKVLERATPLCSSETETFVLQRHTSKALAVAGQWVRAAEMLAHLVQHERELVPDDIWASDSIAAIQARVRARGADTDSADHALRIAGNAHLPNGVRLEAASIGLTVATTLNDHDIASGLWEVVRDIAPTQGRESIQHLHLMMLYHIAFGDATRGFDAADRLAATIERSPSAEVDLFPILWNLANAARIRGDADRAGRFASDAFALAARRAATYQCVRAAELLARLAVDERNIEAAARWHSEAKLHASACRSSDLLLLQDVAARILLLQGRTTEALSTALHSLAEYRRTVSEPDVILQTYVCTAVEAHLETFAEPERLGLVDELRQLHTRFRHAVFQDRSVAILCQALLRRGDARSAAGILRDYLAQPRNRSESAERRLRDLESRISRLHDA